MAIFTFWLPYLAPTLISWYRARNGKPIVTTVASIGMLNLFFGWTGIVWLLCLANSLNYNPVAWIALRMVKVLPQGGGAPMPQGPGNQTSSPSSCSGCGGSGSQTCSSCSGRGSWFDAPTSESGTAQLRTCNACGSSGKLRCAYCGGSGRAVPRL